MTECSSPYPLYVVSTSASFGSRGEFGCLKDGVLFNSTGSQLTANETACKVNAQWSGLDDVECWKGIV